MKSGLIKMILLVSTAMVLSQCREGSSILSPPPVDRALPSSVSAEKAVAIATMALELDKQSLSKANARESAPAETIDRKV